ncbi:MAG TPA: NAD(P)-dependent oxidoreductase, partial [Chloroflexota bacterium]|nr:NAD(P)-dependent oxidoreductase [Chloroflexota bacterium]
MSAYYPVCLDLRGRRCVVVGGGAVSARKVEGLLECGAEVTVVAPALGPVLKELLR